MPIIYSYKDYSWAQRSILLKEMPFCQKLGRFTAMARIVFIGETRQLI